MEKGGRVDWAGREEEGRDAKGERMVRALRFSGLSITAGRGVCILVQRR